jgi:hypothetical protein
VVGLLAGWALQCKDDSRIIAAACIGFDSREPVGRVERATDLKAWALTYKEAQTGLYGIPAGSLRLSKGSVGW